MPNIKFITMTKISDKLTLATITASSILLNPLSILAQANRNRGDVNINVTPPEAGVAPGASPGKVISNVISIVIAIAALTVLFYLVWGAFQWITSGGEKEAVGKARQKLLASIIGLMILALAFLLARVVGQIVGIDLLNLTLPTLDKGAGGRP